MLEIVSWGVVDVPKPPNADFCSEGLFSDCCCTAGAPYGVVVVLLPNPNPVVVEAGAVVDDDSAGLAPKPKEVVAAGAVDGVEELPNAGVEPKAPNVFGAAGVVVAAFPIG